MMFIKDNKVSQVICLNCFRRWIAGRPMETRLDELECPNCGKQGYAIETGETCTDTDIVEQAKNN